VQKRKIQAQTNFLYHSSSTFFEFNSSLLLEYGRRNFESFDFNLSFLSVTPKQNTTKKILFYFCVLLYGLHHFRNRKHAKIIPMCACNIKATKIEAQQVFHKIS